MFETVNKKNVRKEWKSCSRNSTLIPYCNSQLSNGGKHGEKENAVEREDFVGNYVNKIF